MGSVKMTDRGGMDAHLPVGSAGDGAPAASRDDGRSYTARGEIEGAGGEAWTHLRRPSFERIGKSVWMDPFLLTCTAQKP